MRFEKLNENKIRIILSNQDLAKNNIDFHDFMADPIESQTLFFNMLNEAEKEIGFITKNYNIKIEALQISGGDFVITITRSLPDDVNVSDIKKKIHVKRKAQSLDTTNAIYCFYNFDDFCDFSRLLHKNDIKINAIAKNISLYEYNQYYYVVFSNINLKCPDLKKIFSSITEFATYVNNASLFKSKLAESGKLVIKNNAVKTAIEYFA